MGRSPTEGCGGEPPADKRYDYGDLELAPAEKANEGVIERNINERYKKRFDWVGEKIIYDVGVFVYWV